MADHQPPVRLNTVAGLGHRLHLSRSTIEAMIRDGRLEAVRFGRAIRIPEDSVTGLITAMREGDGAGPPLSDEGAA